MFTGIINHIGTIRAAKMEGDLTLSIVCDWSEDSLTIGESIACNGVCLTVTEKGVLSSGEVYFNVALSAETLSCTAPYWNEGDLLHMERAMKLGDSLDGHIVTGHVDTVAILLSITPEGDSHVLKFEAPKSLSHFIAEKGSVTLNGISLTVNKVEDTCFWVNIIPHTWQVTLLNQRKVGDKVNIEIDTVARYVARLLDK